MYFNFYTNGNVMAKKKVGISLVLIRLPVDVHKNLKIVCAVKGKSIQESMVAIINSFVDQNLPDIKSAH